MPSTETILDMWKTGRSRYSKLLPNITEEKLTARLHPQSNSIGFLIRHIAEVEQAFAKNIFGTEVSFLPKTLGSGIKDTGLFTNLSDLLDFNQKAVEVMTNTITSQKDSDWTGTVESPIFGKVTKADTIARIISHTAYHAGQIGLILKYAE